MHPEPAADKEAGRALTIVLLLLLLVLGAGSFAFVQKWKLESSHRDLMTRFIEQDYVCCELAVARREPRCETILSDLLKLSRGDARSKPTVLARIDLRRCSAVSFIEFAGDSSALRQPIPFLATKLRTANPAVARKVVQLLLSDDSLSREVALGVRNGTGPLCWGIGARAGSAADNGAAASCPGAPALVAALAALLEDDKEPPANRENAAAMFTDLGDSAAPAVPALVRALESRPPSVRGAAATALTGMGPKAFAALPALLRLVYREPYPGLREKMIADLGRLDPQTGCCYLLFHRPSVECTPALATIAERIRDAASGAPVSPGEECPAAFILGLAGDDSAVESPMPTLTSALRAPAVATRRRAARTIALIAGTFHWSRRVDDDTVAALQEALRSGNPPLALDAAEALRQVDQPPPADSASMEIAPFLRALQEETSDRRAAAAWALGAIGQRALPAVPTLQKALEGGDEPLADASYGALNRIAVAAGFQRLGIKRNGKYEMRPEILSALLDRSRRESRDQPR